MKRIKGAYLRTGRDAALDKEIDRLLDGEIRTLAADGAPNSAGRLAEGRALVVIGEAGAGKSCTLKKSFRSRPEFAGFDDPGADCPLLTINAPSPCTLKQLGIALLKGLGYETERNMRENVAWEKVRHQLKARGIRFVHIDEAQHAIQFMHRQERQKVSDTLKDIMHGGGTPVWLILSGLPSLAEFVEEDTQLRRRCRFLRFERLLLPEDLELIRRLIREFCKIANLQHQAIFVDDFEKRLVHASSGQLGICIEIIQDAIEECLTEGCDTLETRHFVAAYAHRSGCARDRNVFTVGDWGLIDPNRTLEPRGAEENLSVLTKTEKKPRRR